MDGRLTWNEKDVSGKDVGPIYVTLSYDFDLRFLSSNLEKNPYPGNGIVDWHETKGITYDFELWPHRWPWSWPWILFSNFQIMGGGGGGGGGGAMECERDVSHKGCFTHYATSSFGLNHQLALMFWIFKFIDCIFEMGIWLIWNKYKSTGWWLFSMTFLMTLICDIHG